MKTIIENNSINQGKKAAGIIILITGGLLLLNQTLFVPNWLFSWPMWLIAWGVYLGGRYNFQKKSWVMLILLGMAFLITENVYHADVIVWPVVIMVTGLWVVFKNTRKLNAGYAGKN